MVRKYSPRAFESYNDYGNEYADCKMEESSYGDYVLLQTYQDETARLKKQVARLKKIISGLEIKVTEAYDYKDRGIENNPCTILRTTL